MTTVGSAKFAITGDNAQAIQAVQQVAQIARRQLDGLKVTPTISLGNGLSSLQAQIKAQLEKTKIEMNLGLKSVTQAQVDAATKNLKAHVEVGLKAVSQGQVDAALRGVTASKSVTVDLKGDLLAKLTEIKTKLAEIKATTTNALTIDTTAVERVITLLKQQITELNRLEREFRTMRLGSGAGGGGGGAGGGSPGARGTSTTTQQLVSQLERLNNEYKRGDASAEFYGRRLQQLKTQLELAARGATAGSADFKALDRALTNTAQGMRQIQADKITALRTELTGARAAFDAAAASAANLGQRRTAIAAYHADLTRLEADLRAMATSGRLTTAQLGQVQQRLGQIARERNTINGGVNIAGLSGNFLNALRSLPGLFGAVGGPLGTVSSLAAGFSSGLGGIAAAAGPAGIAIGAVVIALAGLALGLTKAIAQAEEFQAGMGKISTLTDKFPQQLGDVGQGILKMSADLGKSQTDLQNGMYDILGAGVKGTESMANSLRLLQTSAKLAVAGATDTKTATDVLTSSLNAYGLGADKANAASNKLFQAVLDGKMEFSQLAQSLGMVTPLAAQAGVSFDEVLTALATMTKQGIKPATAVEYLRSALTNIVKPSEQAAGQAKAIGLQFDAAALKSKGFTAFMQDLMVKSKGNSAVLARLIGDVGGLTAVMALGSGGMKSYTDILGKIENATNTTDVAYQKATNNVRHSQEQLSASWKVLLTVVGTPFLEAKKNIIDFTTSVVRNLTDIIQTGRGVPASFLLWRDTVQTAVAPLAGFIKDAFNVIAVAWNSVLKPVLTALWQIWLVIQTAVVTALGVVLNVVRGAISGIAGFVGGLVSGFARGSQGVKVNLGDMASKIATWAETARAYITGVGKVAGLLPQAFGEAGRGIGQIFAGMAKVFAGFGLMAYDLLVKPILPILATVRDAFVGIAEHIAQVIGGMLKWVGEKIAPVAEGLKAVGIGIGESISKMVSGLAGNLKERLFGSTDPQDAALRTQAEAARKVAQEHSAGAKLIAQGLGDIRSGYGDVRGAMSQFGDQARKVWQNVGTDLQKAREDARKTRDELSQPLASTVSTAGRLNSPNAGKADAPLPSGKEKKGKLTVEDINALDAYKRKLDEMNLQQLQSEKALQTRLKDTQRLRLVNAEIHQREVELARAAKKAADEHASAVKKANDLGRQLGNINQNFGLAWSQGKVTPESLQRFQQAVAGIVAEVQKLPKDQQDRFTAIFGQSAELERRGQSMLQLRDQIKGVRDRVNEMSVAQLKAADAYWSTVPAADALVKAIRGRLPIQEAKEYKAGLESLKGALGALSDAELSKRAAAEKAVIADKSQSEAAIKNAGNRLKVLNGEIESRRKLRDVTLEQGRLALQKGDAQAVVDNYEARKQAAQGNAGELLRIEQQLGAEVLAARQRLAQIAAREEILQVQETYRARIEEARKHGGDIAVLEQQRDALIEQVRQKRNATQLQNKVAADKLLIDQTKETTEEIIRLVAERMSRQAALEDRRDNTTIAQGELAGMQAVTSTGTEDLQARLQAEREFGNQVVLARQNIARRAADAELRTELIALAERKKISLEEAAQDSEFISFRMAVLNQLAATQVQIAQDGANKRIAAERALADAIVQINRDLIDGLNQRAQSEAARKVAQSESDLQQELRAVGDNEQAKLDLLTRTQGQREQLARDEINARMKGEREAENRRWDDLQKSSQWTAADQQTREQLARDHQDRLTEIATQGEFDKGQKVLAIRTQTEDQAAKVQEKRAQDEVKRITRGLKDMTAQQRRDAEASLQALITKYEQMGTAGLEAAKVIRAAMGQVADANTDALEQASKLAATLGGQELGDDGVLRPKNLDRVRQDVADQTNKVGKPETRSDAVAKARSELDGQIKQLKADIKSAQDGIAELEKVPIDKLTIAQAKDLERLRGLLKIFTDQLPKTEQAANDAGAKAGQAFVDGLAADLQKAQDAAVDASLQLAEANHKLAQAQGIDDTAAYTTALQAYRDYWRGQIDIAQKGLTEARAAETAARTTLAGVNADPKSTNEAREAAQAKVTQAVIDTTKATGVLAQANTNYVSGQQAVIATLDDARDGINAANDARRQYDTLLGFNTVSYQSEIRSLDELIKKYPAQAFQLEELKRKYQEIQRIRQAGIVTKESLRLDFQIGFNGGEQKLSDTISNVAQGFGQLTNPMALLATIIEKLNIVGTVMEGIFSAIEEPIKALQEPFRIIGQVLGSLIAANLQMLAPILELVVNVFVALYDAIAEFIHKLTFGLYDIRRKNPQDSPSGKKEVADLKGENDQKELEQRYRRGEITRQEYEESLLKLTKERLGREEAAEVEGAKGNEAKIAEIRRKYALQWADEQEKIRQATLEKERQLADLLGASEQKELDRRLRAGEITRAEYEQRALELLRLRLDREEAAEIASAGGSEAEIAAIREKYRLLRLDEEAKLRNALAESDRELGDLKGENDQKELDRRRRQGLISEREYQEESLKLTLDRLERERQAELRAAEGDQRRMLEINRKYDGLVLDAKLDMLDRLKEAYRQIGDTLMGTITGSIKDGLMAALRAGNFGLFRTQFRQKFREAMFEAVLAAAIETAAIKGILQPAIDALTDAFASGDQGAIDKAVQGLMTAGAQAEGMARKIYTALKPLRDAWGIKGENGEQSMTVTGQIDKPEVKISLDALRMLADVINQRLPAYADAINLHVPALRENTLALNTQVPVFSSAIDQFGIHEAAYQQHVGQFGGFVGQFGGFVSQFGQHVGTIAGAATTMQATAQGQASKGYGPSLGGGQYYAPVPKR